MSRPKYAHPQQNNTSDRICTICQSIIEPHTTTDDLMKLKLKHLRSFLNTLDVSTSTCKDKQDLAELVIKSRIKLQKMQAQRQSQQQQQPEYNQHHSHTVFNNGTQNQNSNANSNSFNDKFTGFMNNVQDFVNFNLNSVLTNQPVPCPAPQSTSSQFNNNSSQAQANTNTSTNSNQPNTTFTTNTSSSLPNNLSSVFNFIGEQIPNVINNNLFTFNTSNINSGIYQIGLLN